MNGYHVCLSDTLVGFFNLAVRQYKNEELRERWEHAKIVVLSDDWSIKELKLMEALSVQCINVSSNMVYQMALLEASKTIYVN
jgi:hypothetical protein